MKNYQNNIECAISNTGREGYENVIKWLRDVHFYVTPASVKWHNSFKGGLARHSWQVYKEALKLNQNTGLPSQSVVLCSLLHDVCKFDKYCLDHDGNAKSTGVSQNGKHGLYSVEILERLGLKLNEEEKLAIWWHMGEHELSLNQYKDEYQKSLSNPLCNLIREADHIASHSWYSEAWLEEFEEAKKNHETHPVQQQVFKSTLALTSDDHYYSSTGKRVQLVLNPNALRDNVFCENEITLINPVHQYDTIISVVKQDCLACAHDMLETDPTDDLCVLNMASARNPGGGVFGGAGAQEEYLFRCSDYYRFLYQYASTFDSDSNYKIPKNSRHCYPLGEFGGVYSHGVTIFRDTQANGYQLLDSPWRVNFIAVAAYRLPYKVDRIPQSKIDGTIRKIRAILRIAYNNGQRRLVLGAFGCGAFNNPPSHMAELFKQVLNEPEFQGLFREISFAIIEDHNSKDKNYNSFAEVFIPNEQHYLQGCSPELVEMWRKAIQQELKDVAKEIWKATQKRPEWLGQGLGKCKPEEVLDMWSIAFHYLKFSTCPDLSDYYTFFIKSKSLDLGIRIASVGFKHPWCYDYGEYIVAQELQKILEAHFRKDRVQQLWLKNNIIYSVDYKIREL